jgi:hypothetical protein
MSELAMRLKNTHESGIYRINCDLSDLRKAAAEADFALFDADMSAVQHKAEFLTVMAQAIAAPNWLGKNWDALADALGDLSWAPAQGFVLLLHNGGETFNLSANDYEIAQEILEENVSFWKQQGKPFWVFFC